MALTPFVALLATVKCSLFELTKKQTITTIIHNKVVYEHQTTIEREISPGSIPLANKHLLQYISTLYHKIKKKDTKYERFNRKTSIMLALP